MRVLHLVRPFMGILPEVASPDRKVWNHHQQCACAVFRKKKIAIWLTWVSLADSLPREGFMDLYHFIHLLGLLPNSFVWNRII